jgi:hypothetical protein
MPITFPYTQYGGLWNLSAASKAKGAGTWPVPPPPPDPYEQKAVETTPQPPPPPAPIVKTAIHLAPTGQVQVAEASKIICSEGLNAPKFENIFVLNIQ